MQTVLNPAVRMPSHCTDACSALLTCAPWRMQVRCVLLAGSVAPQQGVGAAGTPDALEPVGGTKHALDRWLAALTSCAYLPPPQICLTVVCAPAALHRLHAWAATAGALHSRPISQISPITFHVMLASTP